MGCGSCGSGGCSSDGCGQKGGCATGGCNKLNTYDWLGNMLSPGQTEVDNIYEVRFKNTRKSFFRNVNGLRLYTGDRVVVESDRGFDVGQLSLGGVLAELQMKKRGFKTKSSEVPRIFRKASERDMELLSDLREKERPLMLRTREIINELKLEMKMSDVEYQGDGTKAIFYYIADHRVDFRELIKVLAREFRIRVEMKQIGLRHEAGLIGGIGACGRELCCSTWLTEFKTVSTSAARYQNLSLNPMKISGLCGRLKCCLNFELDTYLDALQDFPKTEKIKTEKGIAYLQKTDIFKGTMWFSYPDETSWYPLDVEEVKRIAILNKNGESVESLSTIVKPPIETTTKSFDFVDVVGTNVPAAEPRRSRSKGKGGNRRKPGGKGPQNRRGGNSRSGGPQSRDGQRQDGPKRDGQKREGPKREGQGSEGRSRPQKKRRPQSKKTANPSNNPNKSNNPPKPPDGKGKNPPSGQGRKPRNNRNRNRRRDDRPNDNKPKDNKPSDN